MVDENHQNMSKGGCKLSHHAIQIVKIVPCRPCPWKTGKLGGNNTCHKFVLAWKQWKSCMQTGTFSQHLGWVFIGPCHPSAHGPPVDELRKNALHWNEKTLRNRARHTHSSFTQPVLHHLLSFLPFPSHFHICLVIIGRSWFVGLSGPLISILTWWMRAACHRRFGARWKASKPSPYG